MNTKTVNKSNKDHDCLKFREKTRAYDDSCAVDIHERQSTDTGHYQINNFFRKCNQPILTKCAVNQLQIYPKVWGNVYQCEVDDNTDLTFSSLTNLRNIQQLFARPYADSGYKGAGANNAHLKDLESSLIQGQFDPSRKELDNTHEVNIDRFEYLPEFGNPQKVSRTIMPITRGGVITRELVRRMNYVDYNSTLGKARVSK